MSILHRSLCLTILAVLAFGVNGFAEERAKIKDARVNIRGQAVLTSEVVTQLQKDEEVAILEEITPANPKPGEPLKWAKIRMPANTPVWIFGPYIKDKTTASRRLNLRAGPGENYSVVGRLEKGDGIAEIRTVGEWIEIETPKTAYAFVDSALLIKDSVPPAPAAVADKVPAKEEPVKVEAKDLAAAQTPTPASKPATFPTPLTPNVPKAAPLTKTTVAETPPTIVVPPPAPVKSAVVQPSATPPIPAPQPAAVQPVVVAKQAAPTVVRRLVRREGTIHSTRFNIQAPTYFELNSNENGKPINYVHAEKSGINLKEFRGKRVIVTGEEGIDPRYAGIPVLELETIETAP